MIDSYLQIIVNTFASWVSFFITVSHRICHSYMHFSDIFRLTLLYFGAISCLLDNTNIKLWKIMYYKRNCKKIEVDSTMRSSVARESICDGTLRLNSKADFLWHFSWLLTALMSYVNTFLNDNNVDGSGILIVGMCVYTEKFLRRSLRLCELCNSGGKRL